MIYLTLDQAIKTTGYAVYENEKLIANGHFTIAANKSIEERLDRFVEELELLIISFKVDKIFYEDIQYQNNAQTFLKLAYIQAMIIFTANSLNIEAIKISPSHWRSIIKDNFKIKFGKVRSEQKNAAKTFVKNHFNIIATEDECDAICLGLAAIIEQNKNISAF